MKDKKSNEFVQRTYPVEENMLWIKTAWISERAGYIALTAFIIFSLLGGFSQGILSDRLFYNADENITINYERLLRNSSESNILITYPSKEDKQTVLTLKGNFIRNYNIEYITPHTVRVNTNSEGITLYPPVNNGKQVSLIKVTFKPNKNGRYHMSAALNGKEILTLNQYVLP